MPLHHKILGTIRILLGSIFGWAFIDKLFGFGFTTCNSKGVIEIMCDNAWIQGGSPTLGFLKFGTQGPFAGIFQSFAGAAWADWLFMFGLLGIGVALMLGIGMRIGTYGGAVLLILMYLAALPPEHNPLVDDHIIYAVVLLLLGVMRAGRWCGLGDMWEKMPLVKKYPWLA